MEKILIYENDKSRSEVRIQELGGGKAFGAYPEGIQGLSLGF
jgi:hypothetical protein